MPILTAASMKKCAKIFVYFIFLWVLTPKEGQSSPQLLVLAGNPNEGSYEFATELARLWRHPSNETNGVISVKSETFPSVRIEKIMSRQGDLAILDAKMTSQLLPLYPKIKVISFLWSNLLHIVSRHNEQKSFDENNHKIIKVHENASSFAEVWSQLLPGNKFSEDRLLWFSREQATQAFLKFNEDALIFTSPYPLQELTMMLKTNRDYQLIPPTPTFMKRLQKAHPWIQSGQIPSGTYPGLKKELSYPISYPALVGRDDLTDTQIEQILTLIFSQKDAINPHILFQHLDVEISQSFKNDYSFHPAAQVFFEFDRH